MNCTAIRVAGWSIVIVIMMTGPANAQRQGSIEMGGYFEFNTQTDSKENTENILRLKLPMGFYFSRQLFFEIQPLIDLSFTNDFSQISLVALAGPSFQLADLSPTLIENPYYKYRDVGTVAAIYGTVQGGFWSEGFSEQDAIGKNYVGAAAAVGMGTRSSLGQRLYLRTQAQVIVLFPSGTAYDFSRTVFSISVGLSTLIKF
ncbi:hypothetical protein JW992_02795 [candidate division KSB1 bacterium]|nr:hypothetical protein [candidate division KSB1 bacterium]